MPNSISNAPVSSLPVGAPNGDYLKMVGGVWTAATLNLVDLPLGQGVSLTELAGPDFQTAGLPGATAASRYVGATVSGHPTSGFFVAGDLCVDHTGKVWICTAAGTPGTWVDPSAATGPTIQRGSVSITCTNMGSGTVFTGPAITFPTAFVSAPSVLFMLDSGAGAQGVDVPAQVVNRSATGFTPIVTLVGSQTANRTYTLLWVAIGT